MGVFYKVNLIRKFVCDVFPIVDEKLEVYLEMAKNIPNNELSRQAVSSIKTKKFHCQGGGIYALYPGVCKHDMISFIVSYQTISDYLDNLCDRADVVSEKAFRQLHFAMTDALDPADDMKDYYKYYPYKDDGGYLAFLVKKCKKIIRELPSYEPIKDRALFLAKLYSDLQVYKHLALNVREEKMKKWFEKYLGFFPEISGWEFSAATGSTLCIFLLIAAAMDRNLKKKEVDKIFNAYFPWICGLHILLDYYIDLYEDKVEGDLNFVSFYNDIGECENRIKVFLKKAKQSAMTLKHPLFHKTIVEGLMALYLSDPKAVLGKHKVITGNFLKESGCFTKILHFICLHLRKNHRL